jgi:carbonic anhydrase
MKNVTSSTQEALNLLVQGNTLFLKHLSSANDNGHDHFKSKLLELVRGDHTPCCAILNCSDSRVPSM